MISYQRYDGSSEYVRLTDEEVSAAARHGKRMREVSLAQGDHDHRAQMTKPFPEEQAVRNQCLGALAETVVRKYLGLSLELPMKTYGEPDIPPDIEVKLIGDEHYGLRIYPDMPDLWRVVGVVIPRGCERDLSYRIAGWLHAGSGKREAFLNAPHGGRPVYWVPQNLLLPPAALL